MFILLEKNIIKFYMDRITAVYHLKNVISLLIIVLIVLWNKISILL